MHTYALTWQAGAALYVDETYVLQVSSDRGRDPVTVDSTTPVVVGQDTFYPTTIAFGADAEATDGDMCICMCMCMCARSYVRMRMCACECVRLRVRFA